MLQRQCSDEIMVSFCVIVALVLLFIATVWLRKIGGGKYPSYATVLALIAMLSMISLCVTATFKILVYKRF